jgi:LTXXQ motif family protein
MRNGWVFVAAVFLTGATAVPTAFAQFNGREILDNICKNVSRDRHSDQSEDAPKKKNRVDRPASDLYERTEHELALLETDLKLNAQQKEPWQLFAGKMSDYAGELSRERARTGVPAAEGAATGGLQHIEQLTDTTHKRLAELQEIRSAANKLYATLSTSQKKIADTRIVTMIALSTADAGGSDANSGSARARR